MFENGYRPFTITDYESYRDDKGTLKHTYTITFLNTGSVRTVTNSQLRHVGSFAIADKSLPKKSTSRVYGSKNFVVGKTFENGGSPFTITGHESYRDDKGTLKHTYTIRFLNTGSVREVPIHDLQHLSRFSIRDKSLPRKNKYGSYVRENFVVGQMFENGYRPFTITGHESYRDDTGTLKHKYTIKFLNTGSVRTVTDSQLCHIDRCNIADKSLPRKASSRIYKRKFAIGKTFENGGSPFTITGHESYRDDKGTLKNKYTITFLNTGSVRTVTSNQLYNISKSYVTDKSLQSEGQSDISGGRRTLAVGQKNQRQKDKVGQTFENGDKPFVITSYENHRDNNGKLCHSYTIRFLNTGTVRTITDGQLYNCSRYFIADPRLPKNGQIYSYEVGSEFENNGNPFVITNKEEVEGVVGKARFIFTIKFLNTGNTRRISRYSLYDAAARRTNIVDTNMPGVLRASKKGYIYVVGAEFENGGRPFVITHVESILDSNNKRKHLYTIKFLGSGATRVISRSLLYNGVSAPSVADRTSTTVNRNYPVADLSLPGRRVKPLDVVYNSVTKVRKKDLSLVERRMYGVWRNMLDRCYNPNRKSWRSYGGRGVTVDERWHSFENFKNDIPTLDGYDEELYANCRLDLDKDFKQKEVQFKVYSKDTCVLLLKRENIKLAHSTAYKVTQDTGKVLIATNIVDFCREYNIVYDSFVSAVHRGHLLDNGWKIEKVE